MESHQAPTGPAFSLGRTNLETDTKAVQLRADRAVKRRHQSRSQTRTSDFGQMLAELW